MMPLESINVEGMVTFGNGGDDNGGNSDSNCSSVGESNPVGLGESLVA